MGGSVKGIVKGNGMFAAIGLYRDVWIAAIASSRTRVTTLSGVKCNTSQ